MAGLDNYNKKYQSDYSDLHPEIQYNVMSREMKGKKIFAVLEDYFKIGFDKMKLCDVGCSTGIQTRILSEHFQNSFGVDIDKSAIQYANKFLAKENLRFIEGDSMNLPFTDGFFDVVVCTHVYEHVPDANRLMDEIYRVLKPDGVCYFAAGNRLQLVEPHYKLPLLSVIPRSLANIYIKFMGKGSSYYERLLTLPSLNRLVKRFEKVDYTKKIILDPEKYSALDIITPGSLLHNIAVSLMTVLYPLLPDYIWILRRNNERR